MIQTTREEHALHPRLSDAALAEAQADPDVGYIVDAPYPNAPLIITFGFVAWDSLNNFDFAGRTRKLEATTGQRLNRILVRDTANLWYQHGVSGLGLDIDATAASLRALIAKIRPAWVSTVGQSMGAYAAILFGALLGVDQVLAFGPLSYLRSDWARRDGDTRWLAVMDKLDRYPPPRRYDDLPALLQSLPRCPSIHIVIGTAAEAGEAPNLDRLHAERFARLPDVTVEEIAEAPHAVVKWLIDARRIDDVLQHRLLVANGGTRDETMSEQIFARFSPQPAPSFRAFDDGWRGWIAENLVLGVTAESLLQTLVAHQFHPGEAQREIDKARRSPYILPAFRLAQRVAKRDWTLESLRRVRQMNPATQAGITRRHKLNRDEFLTDHYSANRPVIITGMMEDWPAMAWTPDVLVRTFAGREVQVQTNRSANPLYEREAAKHHETMRFDAFMQRVMRGGESNDIYMTANNGSANAPALAELWDGIVQIPEYLDGGTPNNRGFFWIGPAGTVTPTHHDLTNNFMAQIMGRKRVHLVDSLQVARLYNHLHVYSDVDLENIDHDRFPLMREVEVLSCDLAPGELLFIPVGWWHHVRALDVSVTVTFTNFVFDNDFYSTYRTYQMV